MYTVSYWRLAIDFLATAKKPEISQPFDPVHLTHVGFNSSTGEFTGLPKEWQQLLQESGISRLEQERNPQAVMEIVKFYQEGRGEYDKMGNMGVISAPTFEEPQVDEGAPSGFKGFTNPVRLSYLPSASFYRFTPGGNRTCQERWTNQTLKCEYLFPPLIASPSATTTTSQETLFRAVTFEHSDIRIPNTPISSTVQFSIPRRRCCCTSFSRSFYLDSNTSSSSIRYACSAIDGKPFGISWRWTYWAYHAISKHVYS